jgi:hypothetical protein
MLPCILSDVRSPIGVETTHIFGLEPKSYGQSPLWLRLRSTEKLEGDTRYEILPPHPAPSESPRMAG